ncbi:tyrosine-type recombinase/integrase [Pseudoxanthomonas wuyuanensis]
MSYRGKDADVTSSLEPDHKPRLLSEVRTRLRNTVRVQHARDLEAGIGTVYLPNALARKYMGEERRLGWQHVFPANRRSIYPRDGRRKRRHLDPSVLQRALRTAAKAAGIVKPVTSHTLRHCFATQLLQSGLDIRTVQELMGHKGVATTQFYTHVLNRGPGAVLSPLDR